MAEFMKTSKKTPTTENLLRQSLAAIILLLFVSNQLSAEALSLASREIFNYSLWPEAYRTAGLIKNDSYTLQSLNRFSYSDSSDTFSVKFEMELISSYNSSPMTKHFTNWGADKTLSSFKAFKTGAKLLTRNKTTVNSEIERLELLYKAGNLDVQIGRQPVSLGTSHFVSILDVLAPVNPGYMDASFKQGIDVIRVRSLAGAGGEAELIAAASRKSENGAIIGRYRDTFKGFDVEVTGGRFNRRRFVGIAFEGERRKINLWGETGFFARRNSHDRHFGGFSKQTAVSWIIGAEKNTGNNWRNSLAMMHQDFGARKAGDLEAAYATFPLREGWAQLAASDYIIFNARREMTQLNTLNVNILHSLVDNSSMIQPVINISTSDESDLSLFVWLNRGKKPVFNNNRLSIQSEFGATQQGVGLIYRRFF